VLSVRGKLLSFVHSAAGKRNAFDDLESDVRRLTTKELKDAVFECGVIPEAFSHDSSEEKLWAKVCDILLAMAMNKIGIQADVIRARGNSADVLGKTKSYTLVGDAKAFRLSRTAKNQKDFKITALEDWRRENTFACLVGPLKQYPNTRSQIYSQSVKNNVTLVSYTHLRFLLDHGVSGSLEHVWTVGKRLSPTGRADEYWTAVNAAVLKVSKGSPSDLEATMELEVAKIRELGTEGIRYWEGRIADYHRLSRERAISKLIKAEKIEEKIETIKRAVA